MDSAAVILIIFSIGHFGVAFPDLGCIRSYHALDSELISVQSAVPLTWLEMQQLCWTTRPGYVLSLQCTDFQAQVVAMCPEGGLVPIGVVNDKGTLRWNTVENYDWILKVEACRLLRNPSREVVGSWGALRWPNQELVVVGNETKFTCAICTMADREDAITVGVYETHNNSIYAYDLELVSHDRIDDLGLVANGSDLTNKLLDDLALAFDISSKALRWHGATLNEDRKAVVHVYYDRGDVDMGWVDYVHWNDPYHKLKEVDNFALSMIKVNTECLGDTVASLQSVRHKAILTGYINVTFDLHSIQITLRECYWDATTESATWTAPSSWFMRWGSCTRSNTMSLDIMALKDPALTLALRNLDLQVALSLVEPNVKVMVAKVPDFRTMITLENFIAMAHTSSQTAGTALAVVSYSIALNLGRVYMLLTLDPETNSFVSHTKMVNVVAADHDLVNPLSGLALVLADGSSDSRPPVTQLHHDDMASKLTGYHLAVTVSDSIAVAANRLVIATYAAHLDFPNHTIYDDSVDSWMAGVHVAFTRNESGTADGAEKDFVDIAFKPVFRLATQRGKCAERDFETNEWFGGNCRILKSPRDGLLVCRCRDLYKDGDFTSGFYLIYGFDASLSTYLANNLSLIIVMIFVTAMSALGLLSVVATAIYFPDWRKDQGHQIFMQMILALTVNLILGFVNNFFSIDTKSIACIAVGVVRHYSFLAMFFWMMILSGLQVKRLTTISSSKSITHLILKVSLIAWGLPLIPIVILLSWDTGFYKSEGSNRGYCYPEDVAFQATVQGPAGIILIVNLIIFVIILNHIYGWVKCNNDAEVRKHTSDDRAAQLRNFANSVFVFFLFGFTWVFHFLSEEGIINSEFLFEFLFLITAAFHLLMLSMFFIVLDNKTRTLWMIAVGRKKLKRGTPMLR